MWGRGKSSTNEQKLLDMLSEHRGRVVKRDHVLSVFWPGEVNALERELKQAGDGLSRSDAYRGLNAKLDALIKRVREKLGDQADLLQTIRSIGFIYDADRSSRPLFALPAMMPGEMIYTASRRRDMLLFDEVVAIRRDGRYLVLGLCPADVDLSEEMLFDLVRASPVDDGLLGLCKWADAGLFGQGYSFDKDAGMAIGQSAQDHALVITKSGCRVRMEYLSERNEE